MTIKTTTAKFLAIALIPLLPTSAMADWSGAYAGGSLGTLTTGDINVESEDVSVSVESDAIFGAHAGYQVQQGDFVYGGELAFTAPSDATFSLDGDDDTFETPTSFIDLKARAGYAINDALVYGVVGVSKATANVEIFEGSSIDLTADGFNFGLGADYLISDNIVIGAEYLARRMTSNVIPDTDVNADTFAVRASFKF